MPACLIDQEHCVCAGRNGPGDLDEMQVHRFGIAGRQDQGCTLALLRADRAEDVGGGSALITGRAGPRAALGPPAGDLVFLADTGLVLHEGSSVNDPVALASPIDCRCFGK